MSTAWKDAPMFIPERNPPSFRISADKIPKQTPMINPRVRLTAVGIAEV